MPDHIHLILNPIECDISLIMRKLKGKSAKLILDLLRRENHSLLSRLNLILRVAIMQFGSKIFRQLIYGVKNS